MPHVTRSIELDAPVDTIHQQWLRWEQLPRCAAHSMVGQVRWRAEVLTFEPLDAGTRITLRIDYDAGTADAGLPRRIEGVLQSFVMFFEWRRSGSPALQSA